MENVQFGESGVPKPWKTYSLANLGLLKPQKTEVNPAVTGDMCRSPGGGCLLIRGGGYSSPWRDRKIAKAMAENRIGQA